MDLEYSKAQLTLQRSAGSMLARHAPLSLARAFHVGDGDPRPLWDQITRLGWLEVGLEAGDPFGVPGLCLLAEQLGRRAAPTTLVDTAFVARVALALNSPWADRFAAGDPTVALALLEPDGSWLGGGTATRLVRTGDGLRLSGCKTGVHHAAAVGCVAVVAECEDAPVIACIPPDRAGVTLGTLRALDPSCAPSSVRLENVEVREDELLTGPDVEAAFADAFDVGATACTAEGLGAAGAALAMAVTYALEREQYGRPIGGFQGLRHLLAEAHQQRETAWASVLFAAAALEDRSADAHGATLIAKLHGAAATKAVVEVALQVFGGIGMTFASDLHLIYRRALECADRFGGIDEYEQQVAQALLTPEPALAGR